ncbi:MAG: NAD-binding protein, partial [Moraxellaceae bacterium]|nr:NAD-binding protein [Moraxellaceae bacterium]
VLTPLFVMVLRRITPTAAPSMDGVEEAQQQAGSVLIIGFGRFGQIASQSVLARGCSVTIIDTDTQRIRDAADFGFKVYYGDGTRLDVLHAAGAAQARAVLVCVESREGALRTTALLKETFPLTRVLVRAYDREHAQALVKAGADYQIRETFESAMLFGQETLKALGVDADEAEQISADVRRRDHERFVLESCGGIYAGTALILGNKADNAAATPSDAAGSDKGSDSGSTKDEAGRAE